MDKGAEGSYCNLLDARGQPEVEGAMSAGGSDVRRVAPRNSLL